jgi:hypothetical protein
MEANACSKAATLAISASRFMSSGVTLISYSS